MSSLVLTGDTSGQVTLAAPAVAGTNTITLAAQTGTLNVAAPAFSAYQNATTSMANSTATKIALQVEEFDTASAFDNTTNYRFTPQVAGYYQVNGCVNFSVNSTGFRFINIYKNGTSIKAGQNLPGGSVNYTQITVSALVFLNGSTDYIELFGLQNSGSTLTTGGNSDVYFQAALVRGA